MGGKGFLEMMSFPFVFKNMASYTLKMLDEGDRKQIAIPFPSQGRQTTAGTPLHDERTGGRCGSTEVGKTLSTRACH